MESESSLSASARRKQLKDGMEHLRGFVTVSDSPSSPPDLERSPPIPVTEGDDTYGVPSSVLEPVRRPRPSNYPPENALKRTDPFQFGSRYLTQEDDIFAFNAWDHVETDEAYKEFAEECYAKQKENPVSEFDRKRFNEHPERQWNKFYANNTARFFKDRKWLRQEFPALGEVMAADAGDKVVLEIGAGAGNTAFPILKNNENEGLVVWACDFSSTAVKVIQEHEEYRSVENKGRIEARVWDAAATDKEGGKPHSLPEGVEAGSVDVLIMIFIFSALAPEQWEQAVRNAWYALKPGGVVLFRDYGRGDLAQVRFKKGRWMGENFYVRGDGTRVYFFEEEELRRTWGGAGFGIDSFGVDRRMLVNRQRRLKMYRCWMQAVFRKPISADGEDAAVGAVADTSKMVVAAAGPPDDAVTSLADVSAAAGSLTNQIATASIADAEEISPGPG